MLGIGNGTFAAAINYGGDRFGIAIGDLNGDGRPTWVGSGGGACSLRSACSPTPETGSSALRVIGGRGLCRL